MYVLFQMLWEGWCLGWIVFGLDCQFVVIGFDELEMVVVGEGKYWLYDFIVSVKYCCFDWCQLVSVQYQQWCIGIVGMQWLVVEEVILQVVVVECCVVVVIVDE